jgi:ribA/ribD-fused uncharacterized protein
MAILRTGLGAFAEPDRLLQDLLARGVDLERLAPDLAALLRGQPQFLGMARLLLDRGADTSAKDRNGATPLAGAVEKGRIEMVDLLLEHGAARVWDSSGESLVGEALGLGRLEIAELLLRHGATFDATKPGRLHTAAQGQHLPVLRWLLDRGADIDQRDEDGDTPLLTAARSGRAGAVSTLIALGADVRLRNHRGDGLLHAGGDSDCISELLRHGLPVDEPNADGRTPLHLAATVSDRAGVLALLGAGASANAGDNSGNSPLHLAFSDYEPRPDHEFPVFHALVAAGADRSTRNAEGLTAYDLAVHHQYPEEYRRLLDPVAAAPPEAFVWLGEEAYADFLPRALVRIDFDGVEWPSSEHYFHARKTADADVRERMRQAPTLAEALRRLHEKRIKAPNDWPARCGEVMRFALSEKFRQHVELRARLLATGDAVLVSDSQCDNYWYEAPGVAPFNAIGHMLMELRSKLREAG